MITDRIGTRIIGIALALAGVAFLAAETVPQKEEFQAFAITPALNSMRTISSIMSISIDRWSTETEMSELVEAFNARGQDGLLALLQNQPKVGYFRMPDRIGYALRYAFQQPDGQGGRRIVLATDRAMDFYEISNQDRSFSYPFTVIEIHLNKDNRGEGQISTAAKIIVSLDGKYFDVEDFGPLPVLLKTVKKIK
jgi:hypothetical protein